MRIETYGLGGYDPGKPNNNIIEVKDIQGFYEPDVETNVVEHHHYTTVESVSRGHVAAIAGTYVIIVADLIARLL